MDEHESPNAIEAQLKEFERIFKVIVDDLPMGMVILNPRMEILALNKRMKKWFPGIDVAQKPFCYKVFNKPPREDLCSYCPTAKTLRDGQVHEVITETPEGTRIRNYRVISSPVKDSAGRVIAATEMVEDITEKRQVEKRLAEALDLSQKMISSSEFGMAVYKASGGCVFANEALGDMVGTTSGQLLQQNFRQLESWAKSGLLSLAEEVLSREQSGQGVFHFVTTFTKEVWLDCYLSVFVIGGERHLLLMSNDATGRKQAEKLLRDSREMLRLVLDHMPAGVFWKDRNSRYLGCNRVCARDAGLETPDEIIGKTDENLVWKEQAGHYLFDDRAVMESGMAKPDFEEMITTREGKKVWVQTSKIPLRDANGVVCGVMGVYWDITERKLFEEKIRGAKEYAEQIFKVSPSGIFTVDLNHRITSFNRKAEELTGFPAEEVIGKECAVFALDPCEEKCVLYAEDVPKPITGRECRIRRKGGEIRTVLKNMDFLRDKEGKIVGGIENFEDITGRKKMEEALLESEERFHAISDSAQDAIIMMSEDGNISFWNKAAERIFGYAAGEIMGQGVHSFLAPKRFHEAHEKAFPHWRETGEGGAIGKTLELAALRKDGTEFPIELSLSGIKLKGKWSAIGIVRDITERKLAEENFLKRTTELERLNKAMVGRELRMLELKKEMESLREKIRGMERNGG